MHCGNEARFLLCAGFPNWVRLVGGGFGQNGQKLHENYKINILGAKQWGDMEGQANFLVSGGDPPSPPPTRGNPDVCRRRNTSDVFHTVVNQVVCDNQ